MLLFNRPIMKKDLTEILFLLDRSGSMVLMAEEAIAGFNEFLREQLAEPGQAKMTLVLFDDLYEVPCNAVPLPEIVALDARTYVPRGATALLDAMGRSIDELARRIEQTPEAERPEKVIVAILTDGQENASSTYRYMDIQAKVQHQTQTDKWSFLFLGANQDAIATAGQLGISRNDAASYVADSQGQSASMASLSRKAKAIRREAHGDLTLQEAADLSAPLEDIVKEEDFKRRRDQ